MVLPSSQPAWWMGVALLAYAINAASFVVDKYLLTAPIPKPFVYAFWVSALSMSAIVLVPFGVGAVSFSVAALALASGAAFFAALVFLYQGIRRSEISVVVSKIGTFNALFSYIFALVILKSVFLPISTLALILMLIGVVVLTWAGKSAFPLDAASGLFFGLSFVLLKAVFNQADFINAIFWTRMGLVGSACMALVVPSIRHEIGASFRTIPSGSKLILVLNKILVGIGFLLLYYAIKQGDVVIVNAMIGFQFVFVFLLALALRNRIPAIREQAGRSALIRKSAGIVAIFAGFLMILFS